jgi:hypothetical protein
MFSEVFDLKPTSEDKCCSVRCPQRIPRQLRELPVR